MRLGFYERGMFNCLENNVTIQKKVIFLIQNILYIVVVVFFFNCNMTWSFVCEIHPNNFFGCLVSEKTKISVIVDQVWHWFVRWHVLEYLNSQSSNNLHFSSKISSLKMYQNPLHSFFHQVNSYLLITVIICMTCFSVTTLKCNGVTPLTMLTDESLFI